jgi:two-component system nitrate/nitrite sensor histidine kinase NarX
MKITLSLSLSGYFIYVKCGIKMGNKLFCAATDSFMLRTHVIDLPTWKILQRSLLLRIGGAIATIAVLAVLGMSVSGLVAESTQGSGEAINRAGSLRMLSWNMASLYLVAPLSSEQDAAQRMTEAILEFDNALKSDAIQSMLPRSGNPQLKETYQQIQREWQQVILPSFKFVADGGSPPIDTTARAALLDDINLFVRHLNSLVQQLEDTTEAKILVMRIVLGVALILTILVVLLTIQLIHFRFVTPLKHLLLLANHVGQGDLSVRTTHTGEDELGQLGRSFNMMAEDLSKLYQDLEGRVTQKTAELTRSNQSLELLYHSIARLHGAPPGKSVYLALLHDIEQLLELGHGIICLGEHGGFSGQAVASTMQQEDCNHGANPCIKAECIWCHSSNQTRFSIASDFHRLLTLPLADAELQYGVLILEIPEGRQLEAWQVQLLEALSRHIGVAIGAERRIEQNRRVGLLEERAVIARELHDSLAQSLAFMKIQVSRLQRLIKTPENLPESEQVLLELRLGMSSAYRQLRELLSTFRLKMDGQNLAAALAQTVSEFADRGELQIELTHELQGCPLTPNEEIHVLHVVREALSNVINHAHAAHAWVNMRCLADGRVEVAIDDDGQGIIKSADVHHYGMTIMEERARTLAGEVSYQTRANGGSRVILRFLPTSRR